MTTVQPAQKKLSLGFIGVGWIGRNRMEVFLKNKQVRVTAITEPNKDNAQKALKSARNAMLLESAEALLKNPDLDAVVIATPSALHAQQSIQALQAGKAVFCQKPLGRTAAEVREVVQAANKADKLLGVDLSYRHTKAFRAVHNLIQAGNIGKVFAVDLVFHNAYGPDKDWFFDIKKSGGGCVMDLGIHLVDLALWSLNFPEVKSVQSSLYSKGNKLDSTEEQVEDYASVGMMTSEGTQINLQCSWHISAGQDAVIEARFYGTDGGAAVTNINGSFYDFRAERFLGTSREVLEAPPDDWGGRAGMVWVDKLFEGKGHDEKAGQEFIKTTEIIDRIYGR